MPEASEDATFIARMIRNTTHDFDCEDALQISIASMFNEQHIEPNREHRLSAKDRLDFFVEGIAIEVKIDSSLPALLRQLSRYAAHEEVRELMVVTSRSKLAQLPTSLNGKPITVVELLERGL